MNKRSPSDIGRESEGNVAGRLNEQGFEVIERNWRTPFCEIDVIAKKDDTVYMVEVKHRSSRIGGDGFDAITDKKLAQMRRAADAWVHINSYNGIYQLAVASTDAYGDISLVFIDD